MAFSARIFTKITVAPQHYVAIYIEFHPAQQTVIDKNIDNNKLIFVLQRSVILTEPIFMPLTFAQPFKNLCTELHENPTNGLVADTMSRMEGCGLDAR